MGRVPRQMYLCVASVLFLAAAKADIVAYVGSSTGAFGTIDLNTGAFTSIVELSNTVDGLGVLDGSTYASEAFNGAAHGTLFSINTADGVPTAVGPDTGLYYRAFGSTTSGLYAVGYNPRSASFAFNLYSLDPSTGAATLIGPTGVGKGGDVAALSVNAGVLYFSLSGTDLYKINTSTGAATPVGTFGQFNIGPMLMEGGTLYAGDNHHNTIDTINPATGTATVGPPSQIFSDDLGYIYALAPSPIPGTTTPEPGTWSMVGIGAMLVGATSVRRSLRKKTLA